MCEKSMQSFIVSITVIYIMIISIIIEWIYLIRKIVKYIRLKPIPKDIESPENLENYENKDSCLFSYIITRCLFSTCFTIVCIIFISMFAKHSDIDWHIFFHITKTNIISLIGIILLLNQLILAWIIFISICLLAWAILSKKKCKRSYVCTVSTIGVVYIFCLIYYTYLYLDDVFDFLI